MEVAAKHSVMEVFLSLSSSVTFQYIVTEYGVAELFGKNLKERAKALIAIAHPNHREALERAAFEMYK